MRRLQLLARQHACGGKPMQVAVQPHALDFWAKKTLVEVNEGGKSE
jgi:hypothetical protein